MVTIACMIVICSLFIANHIGVIIIALTITSICYSNSFLYNFNINIKKNIDYI